MKARTREALSKVSLDGLERAMTQAQLDAFENEVTGFGTAADKTTYGRWAQDTILSDQELTALYNGSDIAARVVDSVPDEMFREGVEVDLGDPTANTYLSEKLEELNVVEVYADAIRFGRLYGGSAILLGADDGRPASMPLIPERVKSVRYLYVIDRRLLWPLSYYRENGHPKLGQPETYLVTTPGIATSTAVVHETRLIRFGGVKTDAQTQVQLASWDLSVLQRPTAVIRMFDTAWKSVEHMLVDGNQTVMRMRGLLEVLAAPDGMENLQKRLRAIQLYRSNLRSIVLDAGGEDTDGGYKDNPESLERLSSSFESIPNTLDKICLRMAAAVPMPVTILMGQSPAGMNATGESDFRWWLNGIKSQQRLKVTPKVRQLVKLLLRAQGSPIAPEKVKAIDVAWPALWTLPPDAEATRRKTIADTDKTYFDIGALEPDEIKLARFRPEGFGEEVKLTDESLNASEARLKTDLEKIANGEDDETDTGAATGTPTQNAVGGDPAVTEPEASDGG